MIGQKDRYRDLSLADYRHKEAKAEASKNPQKIAKVRLFVSEKRTWIALTGHGPDSSRVFPTEFELLSVIAARRGEGIVQGNLVQLTGQDKRSVPKRTDELARKGYIEKTPFLARGARTSRLTLKRFVGTNESRTKEAAAQDKLYMDTGRSKCKNEIDMTEVVDAVMDVMKTARDGIISRQDLRREVGHWGKDKRHWGIVIRLIRQFEAIGVLKGVKAQSQYSDILRRTHSAVLLVRIPTDKDLDSFHNAGKRRGEKEKEKAKAKRRKSKAPEELDAEGEPEHYENEVVLDPILTAPHSGTSRITYTDDEEYDELVSRESLGVDVNLQRPPGYEKRPQRAGRMLWTPERPTSNQIIELVRSSGIQGLTNAQVRRYLFGLFWQRPAEHAMTRMGEFWQYAQPLHLRHLGLVRDTAITKAHTHYVNFTFENFVHLVAMGHAEWETLNLNTPRRGTPRIEPCRTAEFTDNGWPLKLRYRKQRHGGAYSLQDGMEALALKPWRPTAMEPVVHQTKSGQLRLIMPKPREVYHNGSFISTKSSRRGPQTAALGRTKHGNDISGTFKRVKALTTDAFWEKQRLKWEKGAGKKGRGRKPKGSIDAETVASDAPTNTGPADIFDPDFDAVLARSMAQFLPMPDTVDPVWKEKTEIFLARSQPGIYVSAEGKQMARGNIPIIGRPKVSRIIVFKSEQLKALDWFVPGENIPKAGARGVNARMLGKRRRPKDEDEISLVGDVDTSGPIALRKSSRKRAKTVHFNLEDVFDDEEDDFVDDASVVSSVTPEFVDTEEQRQEIVAEGVSSTAVETEKSSGELDAAEEQEIDAATTTPAKRGRGRPKKTEVKKRGRPPKQRAETSVELELQPPPPQQLIGTNVSATDAVVSGGDNAFRNDIPEATMPVEPLAPPKRKRGRPPKKTVVHADTTIQQSSLVVPEQTSPETPELVENSAEGPRRSGRPAKPVEERSSSKAAVPIEVDEADAIPANESQTASQQGTKRKAENQVEGPNSSRRRIGSESDLVGSNSTLINGDPVMSTEVQVNGPGQSDPRSEMPQVCTIEEASSKTAAPADMHQSQAFSSKREAENRLSSPATPKRSRVESMAVSQQAGSQTQPLPSPVTTPRGPSHQHSPNSSPSKIGAPPPIAGSSSTVWQGSTAVLRSRLILELIDQCGGCFPASSGLRKSFIMKWRQTGKDGNPDLKTIQGVIKTMVDKGQIKKGFYSAKDRSGVMVSVPILTRPETPTTLPRIGEMAKAVAESGKMPWFPPELGIELPPTGVRKSEVPPSINADTGETYRVHLRQKPAPIELMEREVEEIARRKEAARRHREYFNQAVQQYETVHRPANVRLQDSRQQLLEQLESGAIGPAYNQRVVSQRISAIASAHEPHLLSVYPQIPNGMMGVLRPPPPPRYPLFGPRNRVGRPRLPSPVASDSDEADEPTGPDSRSRRGSSLSVNGEEFDLRCQTLLYSPAEITHESSGTFGSESIVTRGRDLTVDELYNRFYGRSHAPLPTSLEELLSRSWAVRAHKKVKDNFIWDVDAVWRWELRNEERLTKTTGLAGFINHMMPEDHTFTPVRHAFPVDFRFQELLRPDAYGITQIEADIRNPMRLPPPQPAYRPVWRVSAPSIPSAPRLLRQPRAPRKTNPPPVKYDGKDPEHYTMKGTIRKRRRARLAHEIPAVSRLHDIMGQSGSDASLPQVVDVTKPKARRARTTKPWTSDLMARLACAGIAVRCLLGGPAAEPKVDWAVIDPEFPGWHYKQLQLRFRSWCQRHTSFAETMTTEFYDKFIAAVEGNDEDGNSEVERLDLPDLSDKDSYNWGKLFDWAVRQIWKREYEQAGPAEDDDWDGILPQVQDLDAFEKVLTFKEDMPNHQKILDEVYGAHMNISIPRRRQATAQIPFSIPIGQVQSTSPRALDRLEVAKTYTFANVTTLTELYDAKAAHDTLDKIGKVLISDSLKSLMHDKFLRMRHKGRMVPGRNYDITDMFAGHMTRRRAINLVMIRRARWFKLNILDKHLQVDTSARGENENGKDGPGSGVYIFPDTAGDGDQLALLNLFSLDMVTFGLEETFTNPWGIMAGGYQTRFLDKNKLMFELKITPKDSYTFGDPLSTAFEQYPIPLKADAYDDLVQTAPETGTGRKRILPLPRWSNIHGNVTPVLWDMALSAVLGCVALQPGATPHVISRLIRQTLAPWEIELLLKWCERIGVARQTPITNNEGIQRGMARESRGWEVMGFWWMAVRDEMEWEPARVAADLVRETQRKDAEQEKQILARFEEASRIAREEAEQVRTPEEGSRVGEVVGEMETSVTISS